MDIKTINDVEAEFSSNNYNGVGIDFTLIASNSRNNVLVSAPHAVRHTRNNQVLPADKFTGCICKLLNQQLKIPVIYKNKNLDDDVNYDIMSNYEKVMLEYIKNNKVKCIIDLHKSKATRPYDVLIADNNSKNLQHNDYLYPIIKGIVMKNGYKLEHNTVFNASGSGVVSREISELMNIPCIELEINQNILNEKDLKQFQKTYNMISQIIIELDKVL